MDKYRICDKVLLVPPELVENLRPKCQLLKYDLNPDPLCWKTLSVQVPKTLFRRSLLGNGFFNFCGSACHDDDHVGDQKCGSESGVARNLSGCYVWTLKRRF